MRCKVCRSEALFRRFEVRGYEIWRCRACGFGQVFVDEDELRDFYDEAYFKGAKASFAQEEMTPASPAHRYWLEEQLAAFPRDRPLRVLEVGPGVGGPFAGYLKHHRPEVVYEAVEVSTYAADRLRSRGFTVHEGTVADVPGDRDGRFDLVLGVEVIEHDPDPPLFATSVHRLLKPGGRCAFTTGNLDGWVARIKGKSWYYLDPPAHVSFFSPSSAERLFTGAGFGEVGVRRVGFNYIGLALRTRIPGLLFLVDRLAIPTGMIISARR